MAHRVLVRTGGGLSFSPRSRQISRLFSTVLDTPVDPGTQQLRKASVFENALNANVPRTTWTKEEISEVYNTSLIDLTYAAVCVSRPVLDPLPLTL